MPHICCGLLRKVYMVWHAMRIIILLSTRLLIFPIARQGVIHA